MADVTRTQFDEDKAVTKKIFQQATHLMDADLNEQVDVLVNQDRRMLSSLLGHVSKRFGDGFKVVGTGASLQVTIKAGFAGFQIGTEIAALLRLKEDATLSGFTDWSGGARTDYIYIDIEEKEFSPTDDVNIVNPAVGAETCRDNRIVYSFAISEGGAPGFPPAGHTYITLATVTKSSGSNIEAGDVTVSVVDHFALITSADIADGTIQTADLADDSVDKTKMNADVAGSGLSQAAGGELTVDGIVESAGSAEIKIKVFAIGDWNMDTNSSANLAHGLADFTKIRGVSAVIRPDSSQTQVLTEITSTDAAGALGGLIQINSTNVSLTRTTGGYFDNTNYDETSYNRGWVTVWYEA